MRTLFFSLIISFLGCLETRGDIVIEKHSFYYYMIRIIPQKSYPKHIEVFSEIDITEKLLNIKTEEELCDVICNNAYYSGDIFWGYQVMVQKTYQQEELKTKDFYRGMWMQNKLSDNSRENKILLGKRKECIIEHCYFTGLFWRCSCGDIGTTSLTLKCEGLESKPCYVLQEIISIGNHD